jgi:hypothetical protein
MTPNGELAAGEVKAVKLGRNDMNWLVHRPNQRWNSNMHWVSPADLRTHENYLENLGLSGFDEVLQGIGEKFDHIDGLVCFQLTFIAVSHCTEGFMHVDFYETDNKAFNVIIPLMLVDGSTPELNIRSDREPDLVNELKYQNNVGVMLGDMAEHSTASCDYREKSQMRLMATIYLCDVNEVNVRSIMHSFTQQFPPKDDKRLLGLASAHWKRGDDSKYLPKIQPGMWSCL